MEYKVLAEILKDYNWDDGFGVLQKLLDDKNCDLALALEIFYLADGYRYLSRTSEEKSSLVEWEGFICDLYREICKGKFEKTDTTFSIPLTKVQKYKLSKEGVPNIFLEDL